MKYCAAASFIGLLLACLALSGCVSPHAYYGDDGCGGPYAVSGRYADYGDAACGNCEPGAPACGPCGAAEPCAVAAPAGPLRRMLTCNAGCGDLYFGEWQYDPPDACDPCNNHGDFVGPVCCGPSCWQRFWRGVHGVRGGPVGCLPECSRPECDACRGGPECMEPACGCADQGTLPPRAFEESHSTWGEPSLEMLAPESPSESNPSPPRPGPESNIQPQPQPEEKSAGRLQRRSQLASYRQVRGCPAPRRR